MTKKSINLRSFLHPVFIIYVISEIATATPSALGKEGASMVKQYSDINLSQSHDQRTTVKKGTDTITAKFPNDSLLNSLREADIEVIDHFGPEAPAKLIRYIEQLCYLLQITKVQAKCSPIGESPTTYINHESLRKSRFFGTLSIDSKEVVNSLGVRSFSGLNSYAIDLEDFLLKANESGYISTDQILVSFVKKFVELPAPAEEVYHANNREDIDIYSAKAIIAQKMTDGAFMETIEYAIAQSKKFSRETKTFKAMAVEAALKAKAYNTAHKISQELYNTHREEGSTSVTDKLVSANLHALSLFHTGKGHEVASLIDEISVLRFEFETKWLQGIATRKTGQLLGSNKLFEIAYSLVSLRNSNTTNRALLTALINNRGIAQEVDRGQQDISRSSSKAKEISIKLMAMNMMASSVNISSHERRNIIQEASHLKQKQILEIPSLDIKRLSLEDLLNKMSKKSKFLQYYQSSPFFGTNPEDNQWGEPYYGVLILHGDGRVENIHLGLSRVIDEKINNALKRTEENISETDALWESVINAVLKPLEPHIKEASELFIVADSEIHKVPFVALPNITKQKSKPERYKIRMLTSGRDLQRHTNNKKFAGPPLVVANPSFERQAETGIAPNQKNRFIGQSRSASINGLRWNMLPGTYTEGATIASIIRARLLLGKAATTKKVLAAESPLILHIASHGFFLGSPSNESRSQDVFGKEIPDFTNSSLEDPLLKSGIVLAGANQPLLDPLDDGYLTSNEAISMRLGGTEMVVLSACSTSRGDFKTGEGVFGLQRALTIAGARSTLLSLWKVDDAATSDFMTRYYIRLKAGEGRADALASVQEEFRNGNAGYGKWKEPYYWAAWQLVGDWRPIQGL